MKIVNLKSENVKRLNAVEITPDGEIVIIGGRNGQGKTSVLDSIAMAIGGGEQICDVPLKEGTDVGKTTIAFDDDLVVIRQYNKSGTTSLTVQNKAGAKFPSPQAILDKLVGKLSFDPLEFTRLKPVEQRRVLSDLVKLDFTKVDQFYKETFDTRTNKSRDVKRLEGALSALTFVPGLPAEESSAQELNEQLQQANQHNQANAKIRLELDAGKAAGETARKRYDEQIIEVGRLLDLLAAAKEELEKRDTALVTARNAYKSKQESIAQLQDTPTDTITTAICGIDESNRKIRTNIAYQKTNEELRVARGEVESLTSQLEACVADKAKQLQEAPFPIAGLGFTENGVTFNDKPFSQASSAEQLRVSVAIGMAINPKLKVLLCRDGSLLDNDSLKLLSEIVTKNGFQCWVERVGNQDESAIIIEDGYVQNPK